MLQSSPSPALQVDVRAVSEDGMFFSIYVNDASGLLDAPVNGLIGEFHSGPSVYIISSIWEDQNNGELVNTTADSCFGLFGPRQCGVAPGVDQQLLADQQLQLFCAYSCTRQGLCGDLTL